MESVKRRVIVRTCEDELSVDGSQIVRTVQLSRFTDHLKATCTITVTDENERDMFAPGREFVLYLVREVDT